MAGLSFYNTFTEYNKTIRMLIDAASTGQKHTRIKETFALLKEDLARERGLVAGVLALPEDALDSLPSSAFGDLVVCVHHEHLFKASATE